MIITKKKIRNLGTYAKGLKQQETIVICANVNDLERSQIVDLGFTEEIVEGETVLPTPVGKITLFNSQGKHIPLKDKPKETAYRQQEWTWKQFRGRYDFEEKSKIVDIPYKRYPREFIEPPSIELSIASDTSGYKLVAASPIQYKNDNSEKIVHIINIFLEAFGVCEIRNENLDAIIKTPLKRLNWDILPQGKRPWKKLQGLVKPVLNQLSEGNRVVIDKRLESINIHGPEFVAVGRAGFSGYLVFGFPEKNLYILESTETNNATYVIENNWEFLSGLTKAEILNNNLHKVRVVHRESWFGEINRILAT